MGVVSGLVWTDMNGSNKGKRSRISYLHVENTLVLRQPALRRFRNELLERACLCAHAVPIELNDPHGIAASNLVELSARRRAFNDVVYIMEEQEHLYDDHAVA